MPLHLYKTCKQGQAPRWFAVHVEFDDDRWSASCREADEGGQEIADSPAIGPKFYGVTAEQAHRKMLEVLENTFDEVQRASARGTM